jgi:hypothetical protein
MCRLFSPLSLGPIICKQAHFAVMCMIDRFKYSCGWSLWSKHVILSCNIYVRTCKLLVDGLNKTKIYY